MINASNYKRIFHRLIGRKHQHSQRETHTQIHWHNNINIKRIIYTLQSIELVPPCQMRITTNLNVIAWKIEHGNAIAGGRLMDEKMR